MAEEIIDLRDRIEKMRIQIKNEATKQINAKVSNEVFHKTKNSNITLSMETQNINANHFDDDTIINEELNINENKIEKTNLKNETFPALSLSVKNPISNKILIAMFIVQILSNLGILFFLYIGME